MVSTTIYLTPGEATLLSDRELNEPHTPDPETLPHAWVPDEVIPDERERVRPVFSYANLSDSHTLLTLFSVDVVDWGDADSEKHDLLLGEDELDSSPNHVAVYPATVVRPTEYPEVSVRSLSNCNSDAERAALHAILSRELAPEASVIPDYGQQTRF